MVNQYFNNTHNIHAPQQINESKMISALKLTLFSLPRAEQQPLTTRCQHTAAPYTTAPQARLVRGLIFIFFILTFVCKLQNTGKTQCHMCPFTFSSVCHLNKKLITCSPHPILGLKKKTSKKKKKI